MAGTCDFAKSASVNGKCEATIGVLGSVTILDILGDAKPRPIYRDVATLKSLNINPTMFIEIVNFESSEKQLVILEFFGRQFRSSAYFKSFAPPSLDLGKPQ